MPNRKPRNVGKIQAPSGCRVMLPLASGCNRLSVLIVQIQSCPMTQRSANLNADLLPEGLPPDTPHTPARNSLNFHPSTPTGLASDTPPIVFQSHPYFHLTPEAWYPPSAHVQGPSVSSPYIYGQQETSKASRNDGSPQSCTKCTSSIPRAQSREKNARFWRRWSKGCKGRSSGERRMIVVSVMHSCQRLQLVFQAEASMSSLIAKAEILRSRNFFSYNYRQIN